MKGDQPVRQIATAVALAAIGVLVAACGSDNKSSPASSTTTTTTTRPPVAQAALPNLLLTPAEIDSALGLTGTTSKKKIDKLPDDTTDQQWPQGWKFPAECIYAFAPGEATVYAGSGYTAASGEDDSVSLPPGSNDPDPEVTQVVALFPSANEANAFFTASSQRWPACANRQFTTPGDADNPTIDWKVGPFSNANSTLSTTMSATLTKPGSNSTINIPCQRALTVRNNIAIDVAGCRNEPADLAVKVVKQIGDKVDKQ
jgi:hypothetical protein